MEIRDIFVFHSKKRTSKSEYLIVVLKVMVKWREILTSNGNLGDNEGSLSAAEHYEVLRCQKKRTAILLRKQKETKTCDSLLQPEKIETSDEDIFFLISHCPN